MTDLRIHVVSGSHRVGSHSGRMARYIVKLLNEELGVSTQLLDLAEQPQRYWSDDFWQKPREGWDEWDGIAAELRESHGLVVVAPEWHGMVPSALKNFFLLCGPDELADKPAMIAAVSGGAGGAYPVAELRMSSYKNNRLCYIPEHVILREVSKLFLDESAPTESDVYLRGRLLHGLRLLAAYAEALNGVRAAGIRDLSAYRNGM